MTLKMLQKGDKAQIDTIEAPLALRHRFYSLGINKGEQLTLKEVSLAKLTLEIEINGSLLSLRESEAEKINVIKEDY